MLPIRIARRLLLKLGACEKLASSAAGLRAIAEGLLHYESSWNWKLGVNIHNDAALHLPLNNLVAQVRNVGQRRHLHHRIELF